MPDDARQNAPKVGEWSLSWVKDRVRYQHHAALTKYLLYRTLEQRVEADLAGLSAEHILTAGFLVSKGHTSVPQDAIKVFRNVPDAPFSAVAALCRASNDSRVLDDLARAVSRKFRREDMDQEMMDVVDEATVRLVMRS